MSSKDFISQTLTLAKKGKGKVAPNPMVGCVITKKGKIIGEGWHKEYGCLLYTSPSPRDIR